MVYWKSDESVAMRRRRPPLRLSVAFHCTTRSNKIGSRIGIPLLTHHCKAIISSVHRYTKSGDESDGKGGGVSECAHKFDVGELVWGPVKGYASWPGKLEARNADGRWSVRWFGADKTLGCVEHSRLLTLSEGLEAHHAARTKHRKSRKLNALLENAIQEAMAELDKKCDRSGASRVNEHSNVATSITDTPKRSKKHDKIRSKEKYRKAQPRVDGTRLRSSR